MKQAICTTKAPAALGPYSQAIRAGCVLYVSGQLGLDPSTMEFVGHNCVESQANRALLNIKNIIEEAGAHMKDIVSTTVLLSNMEDFAKVNDVYSKFFPPMTSETILIAPPARACYAVKTLPKNALVEITAIAHLEN